MTGLHIDEDGRCSWCGWAPDPSSLAYSSLVLGRDVAWVEAEEWAWHFDQHRRGKAPGPAELPQPGLALAEAELVLAINSLARMI